MQPIQTTGYDLLCEEIRAQHNALNNELDTRKHHPTYGVTKQGMWMRLYRLEGLLYAHGIAGGARSAHFDMQARQAASVFGIHLTDLRIAIKNS